MENTVQGTRRDTGRPVKGPEITVPWVRVVAGEMVLVGGFLFFVFLDFIYLFLEKGEA